MKLPLSNGQTDKDRFLSQLRHHLRKLPQEEAESAVLYYQEYLEDVGEENMEEALATLGNPKDIALQILTDRTLRDIDDNPPSTKRGISAVWLVILGVFSLPITLPLAAVFATVILVLAVCIAVILVCLAGAVFTVLAAFVAVCLALTLGGVFYICVSIPVLFQSISTGFFFFGLGLLAFGLGLLLLPCVVWICKKAWQGTVVLFGQLLPRLITKMIPRRAKR